MANGRERAEKAFVAISQLGVKPEDFRPVLKKLLLVYENKWEHIEADHYQVLVDALFDPEFKMETKATEKTGMDRKGKGVKSPEPSSPVEESPIEESEDSAPLVRGRRKEIRMKELMGEGSNKRRQEWSPPRSGVDGNDERRDKEPMGEGLNHGTVVGSDHSSQNVRGRRVERGNPELMGEPSNKRKLEVSPHGSGVGSDDSASRGRRVERRNTAPGEVPKMMRQECSPPGSSTEVNGDSNIFVRGRRDERRHKAPTGETSMEIVTWAGGSRAPPAHERCNNGPEIEPGSEIVLLASGSGSRGGAEPRNGHSRRRRRHKHNVDDLSRGQERVKITVVNEVNDEEIPLSFQYIQTNTVFEKAHINFPLARISEENCCLKCFGNCLAAHIPCACARETGGLYAYTRNGLLREEFLDYYISMNQEVSADRLSYCRDVCPLERNKNEVDPEPCKGHQVRKFIKECWRKCGCHMDCGNRVVQRGITHNLQVFYASTTKGWGLRSLDELPKGAFVCEYVGEILTNTEQYERTLQTTGNARHTYPVTLTADWGAEEGLEDDDALCLDGTFCGNVARFINHRCYDGNLIGIPVEVETPDHHYYHLAFFTTRNIEALEELTWDYEIDFDDHNHPIDAFHCCCGSEYCRGHNPPNG